MQSGLFWSSFLLVILSHLSFLNGAPTQCPETNLNITGGTYILSKMHKEGSILKYICPKGFYPYPVKKRECDRGRWDPSPTKKPQVCKKVTCPNPNVLENGAVNPVKPLYYVNDTTTYRCHSDYTFQGSPSRVCQYNGKWSGGTPICSRNTNDCPDPGIPPGASREGHIFNIDEKVTYTCDKNLKLIGSKVRVCLDGGQWSGIEPGCYADFTYDSPEEVAEAFSSSLKTTIIMHEESVQAGKKIRLDKGGKLDIYIALDASDSIEEKHFNTAKDVIKKLIEKISYYEVLPNYEIIIFASDVTPIVTITEFKKSNGNLSHILDLIDRYKYDDKGDKSGTNIRKAYESILSSISFEKAQNKKAFEETQHIIIMFTDGIANMGGNPKQVVEEIKQTVYSGDAKKRDKFLDLYAFGVGLDIERERIDEWVTKRDQEKYFFALQDMTEVQMTLDEMIDESTSMGLCGLYKNYEQSTSQGMRLTYPWLIKISVIHDSGTANCVGSLVTPKFILTAAHCFRFDDIPERISLTATHAKESKLQAKNFIRHPLYNTQQKKNENISEYYGYDVALIELKKSVKISHDLRPICIPCTQETNRALQLSASEATCEKQREKILNSDVVKAHFLSREIERNQHPKRTFHIRQGQEKNDCIEKAGKVLNITTEHANKVITDIFLCTGGSTKNFIDDVTCKGDSGGPTFLEKNRLIQVGVISWGLKDKCAHKGRSADTKDFHTNLFSPEVQNFLKENLSNEDLDPLHFL